MPESSCPISACSVITTSITGPISRLMFPRTRHGFSRAFACRSFPTAHLKIEPWIINGWQSYGSSNSRKGLGGQIKWTPYPWMNIVSNNYGLGHDDLYIPNRGRIHTDNSIEIKYFDKPETDARQDGLLVHRRSGLRIRPQQRHFPGRELPRQHERPLAQASATFPRRDQSQAKLHRVHALRPHLVQERPAWFDHRRRADQQSRALSGAAAAHQWRDGSSAAINAPYFTGNPGDQFKAWDSFVTYDYMPRSGSLSAGSMTIGTPACPTGRSRAELRRRVRVECRTPTTDRRSSSPATTATRRSMDAERCANSLRGARQQRMVSRSAEGRTVCRYRHHGEVLADYRKNSGFWVAQRFNAARKTSFFLRGL